MVVGGGHFGPFQAKADLEDQRIFGRTEILIEEYLLTDPTGHLSCVYDAGSL